MPGLRLSGSYPVAEWRDLRSQLMQIPILAGRGIEERDRPGSLLIRFNDLSAPE